MEHKKVLILMGSDSDLPSMREAAAALDRMGIGYDMHVASAHRTPDLVTHTARRAREDGFAVIIAGAGMAAHLAGVVASQSTLPVIGVPLVSGTMAGADALFSTIQMPRGVPVATVGIGAAGAYNAGLLAASILSVHDAEIASRLEAFRRELAEKVVAKDAELQASLDRS
ncbi:MAG: 5-(carboxyamino)imidazole ribonucleotide mutase [Deltaproteobacteria bacterium]|nr:5-(carboxyamino)imidazole ribonucleotide mutase [Deltaproteobacteria bacterium]